MKRCEGFRRHGGAFTLGPVRWEQCNQGAIVMLTVKQDGKETTKPACLQCWNEAQMHDTIEVMSAKPILQK